MPRQPMSDRRKNAYRYLLYHAMLEIRPIAWQRSTTQFFFQNAESKQQAAYVRYAGELAYWLHNLAMFSALDFLNFNEVAFWRQYRSFKNRFPQYRDQLKHYWPLFKQHR